MDLHYDHRGRGCRFLIAARLEMNVRRKLLLASCVLLLMLVASGVDARVAQGRNTWTARSSSGQTFAGTWTAEADPETGSITGTWTLSDAGGKVLAHGGWSAAKAKMGWTGAWRAAAADSKGEYTGTWSATVDLKPNATFVELFARAAQTVVSGKWRTGGRSGAWSIRAYE